MIDWERILREVGPAVWKTAWKVLGNRADADECFQEACMAAVEFSRKNTVQHWPSLLHRLAANRAIDRLRQRVRRRGRESLIDQDQLAAGDATPVQLAQDSEFAARLRSALTELPPKHAEAFCLFHMSGWTYVQIAESLSITPDLVGVWLQRARERLRIVLAGAKEAVSEVKS